MQPLRIGNIQLDAPITQAALSGYSDLAMRQLAREYGCPFSLNEVVLDKLIAEGGKRMRRMLTVSEDEHPVGGQLMGSEPEQFARSAVRMVELGYDTIDINFGCPVRKVLGRCRGGFLLSEPGRAREIMRRVFDAVAGRVPVTVKLRRGMDDTPDSERNFFTILDAAYEIGCVAVTLHGRTVAQRYAGPSRWTFLGRVKRHVGERTLIGSGDLFAATDCVRMMKETGVDGVSLARGAIGNPFIFGELRALLAGDPLPPPPAIPRQRSAIERHVKLMTPIYGAQRTSVLFRKFGVRYSELHPLNSEVKMAFVAVKSPDDLHRLLDRWYSDASAFPTVQRRRPEVLVAAGARDGSPD